MSAITALVTVPIDNTSHRRIFSFSDTVDYFADNGLNNIFRLGDATAPEIIDDQFVRPLQDDGAGFVNRWATLVFEGRVYFTRLDCSIKKITYHPTIDNVRRDEATDLTSPSNLLGAKYIVEFFDHLVVAFTSENGTAIPNRIRWSDLRKWDNWIPGRSSEADYYDLLSQPEETLSGCTGMGVLGNALLVYKSTGIYAVEYVGLPSVMRISTVMEGIGNEYYYGLIALDKLHFFISETCKNIFQFDGQNLTPIGTDIYDYFVETRNADPILKQKLWSYFDSTTHELVWCFCSTESTGEYDREIFYNLLYKCWNVRSCEDVSAFCIGGTVTKRSNNLSGACDQLSGYANGLGTIIRQFDKLWGTQDKHILEETSDSEVSDDHEAIVETELPYIETGDFCYDDYSTTKEWVGLGIQAYLGSSIGIKVEISTRKNIGDPVVFTEVKQSWTPDIREGELSLPRTSGRIIRYRFTPIPNTDTDIVVNNVRWTNFTEHVYAEKSIK